MATISNEINNFVNNQAQNNNLIYEAANKEVQDYLNGRIDYKLVASKLLKNSSLQGNTRYKRSKEL